MYTPACKSRMRVDTQAPCERTIAHVNAKTLKKLHNTNTNTNTTSRMQT